MANDYIVIDSKRYSVSSKKYEPAQEKVQSVEITIGGKTRSQTFGFTNYTWGFELQLKKDDQSIGGQTYGGLDSLKTAYEKEFVGFTDHYGNVYSTAELPEDEEDRVEGTTYDSGVYMLGSLPDKPLSTQISGTEAWFIIPVSLQKRQV